MNIKPLILLLTLVFMMSPVSACATAISDDGFGFRRDSIETANITITDVNGTITESKPGFVHSVVFNDGWAFGIGGADSKICNKIMVTIGYAAHYFNEPRIAILSAPVLAYLGIGHIAIKHPDGAFYVSYNNGKIAYDNVQLAADETLVVPNEPSMIEVTNKSIYDSLADNQFAVGHHRWIIDYVNGTPNIYNNSTDGFQ